MLVLVPAEARKQPQIVGHFLLGVQAKAILHRAESLSLRDVGRGDLAGKILLHRLAVVAHVRMVHISSARAPRPRALHSASGAKRPLRSSNSQFCPLARLKAQSRSMPLATVGMAAMP